MKRFIGTSLVAIMLVVGLSIFSSKPSQVVYAGDSNTPASNKDSSYFIEDRLTEANQKALDTKQPAPTVDTSLERANLIKRAEFINDTNRMGYVYLLSDMGQVIGEYTIKGKPSSLNSYLTQTEQIKCVDTGYSTDRQCAAVTSPDMDGSYGNNPDGIFFFTTDGTYVEWSGKYIYSSQAMNVNTPITLTRTVK